MNKAKAISLSALLLVICLIFTSCGEYVPAILGGTNITDEGGSSDDPINDENAFTVCLSYNGELYIPLTEIEVRWQDGVSYHSAKIGEDGFARVSGLDGEYKVTLSNVPEGYAYDPNAYVATNDKRNIVIEIYRTIEATGTGTGLYSCLNVSATGPYVVDIQSEKTEVFFEFSPSKSGTYSVVSWTDATENEFNPICNYYGANRFFKTFQYAVDGGGAESSYTKNFKLEVEIADEMISDGGQVTFTFSIKATSKNGKLPAKIYFAIMLDGEFSLSLSNPKIMVPQAELEPQREYGDEYTFVGAEIRKTVNGNTANIFDGSMYKLWPKSEGGDDYYHLYDPEAYPESHGYGPILYAFITRPCRFIDSALNTVELAGNKMLTVSAGTENYKLFIEGFNALLVDPPGDNGPYFCVTNCPCRNDSDCPGACLESCEKCHPDCRPCPEEGMHHKGYADYCNSDGVYGVTQELKDFLQKLCVTQLLYFDGSGFVETHPTIPIYAGEDDQWLFACGYYVKN